MSLFLPVRLGQSVAIGVCARCHKKAYLTDLRSDPNSPGLRVHAECADVLDPYRKAMRQPENISLINPRPDEPLDV